MRNILLPTDFSQSAINAIFYALCLMRGKTCTFHLLSVYKAWNYTSGDLMLSDSEDSVYECLLQENAGKLDKLIAKIKKRFPEESFRFEAINSYDVFTDAINKLVELHHIDLIMMGTDGTSNMAESIFGSHTLRVIRKVNAPLLVIPIDVKCQKPRHLLLSLDSSTRPEHVSFDTLQKFFGNHAFSLDILKITKSDPDPVEKAALEKTIRQLFEIYNPRYHEVSGIDANEAIAAFVKTSNIDFHVLPVKKEEFLKRIFGTGISRIIYATTVPLLVLHEAEEKTDMRRSRKKKTSLHLS